MRAYRSVTAAFFVAIVAALLFVALAHSPAVSTADAQSTSDERAGSASPDARVAPEARRRDCGLNRLRQYFRNCNRFRIWVTFTYHDSVWGGVGQELLCVRPGKWYTVQLLGPGRIILDSYTTRRRC